jgi:hypothetical protein
MQSGLVELQASESILGSWLSGVAQRSGGAAGKLVHPGQPIVWRGTERSSGAAGK